MNLEAGYEHRPGIKSTIFYTDLRAVGKRCQEYVTRAKDECSVTYIRSRPGRIEVNPENQNPIAWYEDTTTGDTKSMEVDLVVLSVGLEPPQKATNLAKVLGIQLNKYGFCHTDTFSPVETSRPGIYVCGAFQGPKDIPETVMQASGAAAKSASLLAPARKTLLKEKEYPPEIEVDRQEPRIGVFVCHCGTNIGGIVNVPEVKDFAATLPNVVFSDENLYSCSSDTQQRIKERIREHNLNRVVVASCTPRTHEPLFQETMREAGLNRYLFEMANIRDQCSWVHMHEPEKATQKAKELVQMAVAKARLIKPLKEMTVTVISKALIIGGGVAGMTAALELANQGFECFLVEKEKELGGTLLDIYKLFPTNEEVSKLVDPIVQKVKEHPKIKTHLSARVKDVSGFIGNFNVALDHDGKGSKLEVGTIIVAIGAEELKPTGQHGYGKFPNVLTQLELEQRMKKGALDGQNLVMINCVGARVPERTYCSRICCMTAIKNATLIKESNPKAKVWLLHRDIMAYGVEFEDYYRKSMEQGVRYIRYDPEKPPEVTGDGKAEKVKVWHQLVGREIELPVDLVVLTTPLIPRADNEKISKMLKVPLGEQGFFLEAHLKLKPVEFATDGIYLCGSARWPTDIAEGISQATAAAQKAAIPLAKGYVSIEPIISCVDEEKCIGCGICESLCPFKAIEVRATERGDKAQTITALCKGCGICSSHCPKQAITMRHFTDDQIFAQISAMAAG